MCMRQSSTMRPGKRCRRRAHNNRSDGALACKMLATVRAPRRSIVRETGRRSPRSAAMVVGGIFCADGRCLKPIYAVKGTPSVNNPRRPVPPPSRSCARLVLRWRARSSISSPIGWLSSIKQKAPARDASDPSRDRSIRNARGSSTNSPRFVRHSSKVRRPRIATVCRKKAPDISTPKSRKRFQETVSRRRYHLT